MVIALYAIVLVGAALLLFIPKQMLLLVWFVLLLYPQNLFYGLLPLNAGLDDIYIVALGLRILLLARGDSALRATPVIWLALGMFVVQLMAEGTGLIRYPVFVLVAVRNALKGLVFIVFAAAMVKCICTEEDIRKHVTAFLFALCLAYLLVVLCYVKPSYGQYWEYRGARREWAWLAETPARMRWYGPFADTDGLGIVVCAAVPLALAFLVHRVGGAWLKFLAVSSLVTGAAALVISQSRSAMAGLAGMFTVMALFSRKRVWVIALMIVGILTSALLLVAGSEIMAAAVGRLTWERLAQGAAYRFRVFWVTISNPSPAIFLFAEGGFALSHRLKVGPHNGYLEALFEWGLGGVAMFSILAWHMIKWSRWVMKHDYSPFTRAIAWGVLWGMVSIGIDAMTTSPWYVSHYRFLVYFVAIMVSLRYRLLTHEGGPGRYRQPLVEAETYEEMLNDWSRQREHLGGYGTSVE